MVCIRKQGISICIYILMLLSIVRMEALTYIKIFDLLYDGIKLLAFFVALGLNFQLMNRKKRERVNSFVWVSLLWIFISLFSVYYHHENVASVLIKYMPSLTAVLMINFVTHKKDIYLFFKVAVIYFSFLIIMNFFLLIIFPHGLLSDYNSRNEQVAIYFLGKRNAVGPVIVGMNAIVLLFDYMNEKSITLYGKVVTLLAAISLVLLGSSTGIIGMLIFILIYILFSFGKIRNNKIVYIFFIGSLLISVAVVFFNFQEKFSYLIEVLFKKDASLSSRTEVWKIMLKYIKLSFTTSDYLIGTGHINYSDVIFEGRYAHCHNQFLDIFVQSGIIGVLLFIDLFSLAFIKIVRCLDQKSSPVYYILVACLISFVIMFVSEVYLTNIIVLLLCIAKSDMLNEYCRNNMIFDLFKEKKINERKKFNIKFYI